MQRPPRSRREVCQQGNSGSWRSQRRDDRQGRIELGAWGTPFSSSGYPGPQHLTATLHTRHWLSFSFPLRYRFAGGVIKSKAQCWGNQWFERIDQCLHESILVCACPGSFHSNLHWYCWGRSSCLDSALMVLPSYSIRRIHYWGWGLCAWVRSPAPY